MKITVAEIKIIRITLPKYYNSPIISKNIKHITQVKHKRFSTLKTLFFS